MNVFKRAGNRTFVAGVLCGVALVFAAQFCINETALADYAVAPLVEEDSPVRADAIVVPGAGVIGECTANLNSIRRVLLAAQLWREQGAPLVLFTGGVAGGSCPVARAMSRLARDLGVPDSAIRMETASRTTHENAVNSAPMLRAAGARRLLIATDRLHMRRASRVFTREGFEVHGVSVPISEGHIDNVSMLMAGAREMAALGYYGLRGWLGPSPAARAAVVHASPLQALATAGGTAPSSGREGVSGRDMQQHGERQPPLVVLGASYAGGWKVSDIGGVPVINAGVSGEQSFEMLARFDQDVVNAKPRAVVLWGFINDVFRAQDMHATLARIRESYTEMVARARRHGIEPILATEVTVRGSDAWSDTAKSWIGWVLGKESNADRIKRHVMAINVWLRELAGREGLLLLDIHAQLADRTGARRREFIAPDGSHITAAGYEAVTRYAVPRLAAHFSGRS